MERMLRVCTDNIMCKYGISSVPGLFCAMGEEGITNERHAHKPTFLVDRKFHVYISTDTPNYVLQVQYTSKNTSARRLTHTHTCTSNGKIFETQRKDQHLIIIIA